MLRREIKKEKGITLIALVITIIVLLILASVTINLVIGNNGIINMAKKAGEEQKIAQIKEQIQLAIFDIQSEDIQNGKDTTINDIIEKLPNKLPGLTIERDGEGAKGKYDGYDFIIDKDLNVTIGNQNDNPTVPDNILIEKIELNKNTTKVIVGQEETLTVSITPDNATNKNLIWSSSDNSIATVVNGKITAVNTGIVDITVSTQDGSNINVKCEITVENKPAVDLGATIKIGDYIQYILPVKSFTMKEKQGMSVTENGVTTDYNGSLMVATGSSEQTYSTDSYKGLWRVLYNDEEHGLQIISETAVGELRIGLYNKEEECKIGYNNFINTINAFCKNYINTSYATNARSLGSNSKNPDDATNTMFQLSFAHNGSTNSGFKNEDTNYIEDIEAMKRAGISRGMSDWLASRKVVSGNNEGETFYRFEIRYADGTVSRTISSIVSNGDKFSYGAKNNVRPVIILKKGIKTNMGDGTKTNPYNLVI